MYLLLHQHWIFLFSEVLICSFIFTFKLLVLPTLYYDSEIIDFSLNEDFYRCYLLFLVLASKLD